MQPRIVQETAKAVADRFGVSVKALRVYERAGLIAPPRTANGWRVYGPAEVERIAAILALKQLGLPLKRIGAFLRGKGDLAAVLALQEAALQEARSETDRALALVRAARRTLAARGSLSVDDLGNLVRSTAMSDMKWTPKMEELAKQHYTPEQLAELKARPFTAEDQARVSAAWGQIYADLDSLGPNADPASDAALDIGRRAQALIGEFTRGDPALFKAAGAVSSEMRRDPEMAQMMPGTPAAHALLGRVLGELSRRGAAS